MKLTELRTNHVREPLGFCYSPLSFSWKVTEAKGKKAQSARIRVFDPKHMCYDSGTKDTADSLDFPVEIPLSPRTPYRWELEVTSDLGETAREESWFETGKIDEPWKGKWISPDPAAGMNSSLCHHFSISQGAMQPGSMGRMYICGLGVYEVYLNGNRVGEEYLAPGYHSYDFHIQTQTYDILPWLRVGENEIRILLGEGWFKGSFGFDRISNIYGERLCAIAELYLQQPGQEAELIAATDDSWKSKPSPITFANLYDGEIYDARLEESASEGICFPVQEWAPRTEKMTDRYSLPVVKKEALKASLLTTPRGETLLDFGQNMTGWVEFDAELPKGVMLRMTAGEILQDGCFYHENYRTARSEFSWISAGKRSHVRPHFTFFGFRYMKLEYEDENGQPLCTEDMLSFKPGLSDFIGWHLRSDFDQIGSILTGNEKLNQLFSNVLWGQKDNFLDVPTDCPQRDERLGWTGDAQVFSDTACYNMYAPAFFRKYMWDMRAEQEAVGGAGVNVVPLLKHGMLKDTAVCPWADSAVIIPWNIYRHYGSKSLLSECYPGMKAWVDYQYARDERTGGKRLIHDGFHFADWLALDNPEPGPLGATDPYFIASVYYGKCAEILGECAGILGKEEEKQKYGRLAKEIRQAVRGNYLDAQGHCVCNTQTGEALTIAFDLDREHLEAHGKRLAEMIRDNGNHLNTGFVGTPFLCPALTMAGQHETAMGLLLNESYPGWLYAVNMGATTVWERWNSVEEDGHMNPEGMNSLNHYAYGSIEGWMYGYVCGIRPLTPGFRKASIEPRPDPRIGFLEMELNTAAGKYEIRWRYQDQSRVSYDITIPFGAEAELRLDGKSRRLSAGRYHLETGKEDDALGRRNLTDE